MEGAWPGGSASMSVSGVGLADKHKMYLGHTYTKILFTVYLKFLFNWAAYIFARIWQP